MAYRHALTVPELLSLQWHQIDFKQKCLYPSDPKGDSTATRSLLEAEIMSLRKIKRLYPETPYVFVTEENEPLTNLAFKEIVDKAGEKAKLEFPVCPEMLLPPK